MKQTRFIRDTPYPFEPGVWWVDENGDFHVAEEPDKSVDHLLLRYLQQVKVVVDNADITITWDAHEVEQDGLFSVLDRLSDCANGIRVNIRCYYNGWLAEEYASRHRAIARIQQIQGHRDVSLIESTYVLDQGLDRIADAHRKIQRGFEIWERTRGRFSVISNDTAAEYLPNILIYRPDQREGKLVFSWVGLQSFSAHTYGRWWAIDALRQTYNDTLGPENRRYVDLTCSAYDLVWETGEPHFAQVRALLTPLAQEPTWICYDRLLTRHTLHDGRPALICLSRPAERIKIPIAGAP